MLCVSVISFFVKNIIGYRVVAFILLMSVSILAILFDILPVMLACILSALIWNFFFIPPLFTFHIDNTEDVLLFFMYFIIAMVNAVLTFKIREQEKIARDKEEKENTIKLYNTLLNSLSHELRTPLATIVGAVDTLKENGPQLTENNKEVLLNEIDIATLRLNRQVENLLNSSRLETGLLKPHLIWCELNEIIFSVIASFEGINKSHTIQFNPIENLPLLKLDTGLMEQILQNIIYNAIQYTPENTIINIVADVINESCKIEITDTGQGFPPEAMPYSFEKFYRLPNTSVGGTGLGLSIVKGYVMALGGNINLENTINGGAKFSIQIPVEMNYMNHLKNE